LKPEKIKIHANKNVSINKPIENFLQKKTL